MTISVPAVYATDTTGNSDKPVGNKSLVIGPKVRAGGRFDNVRMCVASPAGTKGGPAADISLSTEIALSDTVSLEMDLPVFRPIMFGLSFKMLQFEPSVSLRFRKYGRHNRDFIFGPMLGVSLHYGPDYQSGKSGDDRLPSFFAMGPMVGGYLGVDFKKPCQKYNFQLGITPYVIPLFGINDDEDHKGIVVGGLLDFAFRFGKPNGEQ
ncbi:MAG: hypothetical protein JXX14_15195 [Deltaproteobacteria bacterium]|nr:hypothetical protein [Deltaproteobacteria bacterium]